MYETSFYVRSAILAISESQNHYLAKPQNTLETTLEFHGLTSLAYLYGQGSNAGFSTKTTESLKSKHIVTTIWEQSHARFIETSINKLKAAEISPLVFKGTAMAYSHYEHPASRLRGDTDIMVSNEQYKKTAQILMADGWSSTPDRGSKIMNWQKSFSRKDKTGLIHEIDLHRELTFCSRVSEFFSFSTLSKRATSITIGDTKINSVNDVDGLIITCFHRLLHRNCDYRTGTVVTRSPNRLIWLFDIHLLASALTSKQWDTLSETAVTSGCSRSCLLGFSMSQKIFKTEIPNRVLQRLESVGTSQVDEFLDSKGMVRLFMKFRSISSLRDKFSMVKELIFPDLNYMRKTYGEAAWVPKIYAQHLFAAIKKTLLP